MSADDLKITVEYPYLIGQYRGGPKTVLHVFRYNTLWRFYPDTWELVTERGVMVLDVRRDRITVQVELDD